VMTKTTAETKLVRVIGTTLVPTKIKIDADIALCDGCTNSDLSNAMTKMKFWLENIVSSCIVFSVDNKEAIDMFVVDGRNRCANMFMLVPGEPTDDILATVFQAKLESLGNMIYIDTCRVKSDNSSGLSFTLVGSGSDMLPKMSDWVGPNPNWFDKPWWSRDDSSTMDVALSPEADISKKPDWAYSLNPDDQIPTPMQPKPDGELVKPKFKPIIVGGTHKPKV
jgi:hypothetical protein